MTSPAKLEQLSLAALRKRLAAAEERYFLAQYADPVMHRGAEAHIAAIRAEIETRRDKPDEPS